jgi:hypothetical protein
MASISTGLTAARRGTLSQSLLTTLNCLPPPEICKLLQGLLSITTSTMKISATVAIAVIASINAEVAMARCFITGWTLQDKEQAKGWVNDACRKSGGMFTGNYAPGQTKRMCPSSSSEILGIKFEVQNQNTNQGFDLGDDDCVKRLYSEIDSCERGGESAYSGWRFR